MVSTAAGATVFAKRHVIVVKRHNSQQVKEGMPRNLRKQPSLRTRRVRQDELASSSIATSDLQETCQSAAAVLCSARHPNAAQLLLRQLRLACCYETRNEATPRSPPASRRAPQSHPRQTKRKARRRTAPTSPPAKWCHRLNNQSSIHKLSSNSQGLILA